MLELSYKEAEQSDYDDFFNIKADKANIEWGGFETAPDYDTFKQWYSKQLESKKRTIYLVYHQSKCVAFFYLDKLGNQIYEASSSGVLGEYCGRGIGTYTLRKRIYISKKSGGKYIISWIADDNIASYRRFEKLGFEKTNDSDVRDLPLLGGSHTFHKWILRL